ncbi:MAG: hypothetical protein WCP28_11765, partial [Actinomycetes bacterium]
MRTTWAIGVLVVAFAAAGDLPVVAAVGLAAPESAAATAAAGTPRVIPRTPTATIPVPRSWPASAARRVVVASLAPQLLSCRKTGTARAGRRLATVSIACKIGTPEDSSVENVREKRAMAILWFSGPKTGALSFM